MKTTIKKLTATMLFFGLSLYMTDLKSQNTTDSLHRKSMTVVNIDTKGIGYDPVQMGNLVRIELDKLGMFEVMDRYDVSYLVEKNKLNLENCYGKICLVEIGNVLKSEKMFSGSVELYGETIIVTMRLVNVSTSTIEKTQVNEFLNLPKDLQSMVSITIREMFGFKNDENMTTRLTKKFNYENSTNNPNKSRLNLSGPRMGVMCFTGETARILKDAKNKGGYDMAYPAMFQFGYQFEKQYLNEGNFQALFEFIPLISGIDQGQIIPSFTFMNGLRNNKTGFEIAFGPMFSIGSKADGYYDNGKWKLSREWNAYGTDSLLLENPNPIVTRMDSRGSTKLTTGFVIAFGKTFKSGTLNIPVNGFIVPNRDGIIFGASFGFNAKKKEISL